MAAYISRIRPVCVEMTGKVALITGGASGLGRAVATSLAQKGWKLSIVDLNTEAGEQTAKTLSGDFHKTDVTDYKSLSSAFHKTFQEHRQIDFVFANAGILERDSFYKQYSGDNPPPEPDMLSVDICLDAVIKTTWLAQHYFRLNPEGSSGCLINTSSTGGIYSSPFCPMYAAANYGVLGFTRSIAKHMYVNDNIRANAILPGVMRTNLLNEKEWGTFDEANVEWTPMNKVVEVVEMLMDDKHKYWGKAVEISGTRHYVREQHEYCDEQMRKVMDVTDADNV